VCEKDLTEIPARGPGDIVLEAAKTIASAFPFLGGSVVQMLGLIFVPPLAKRRDAWVKSIAERLVVLEKKSDVITCESLRDNDVFITTGFHATQIAMRSHQKEKLEALRNAVINAALPKAPDEDLQLMFLGYIDFSTPYHIKVLDFLKDPNEWSERNNAALPTFDETRYGFIIPIREMVLKAFPELGEKEDFFEQLIVDLDSRGLIETHSRNKGEYVAGTRSNLTALGRDFLSFISEIPLTTP